MTTNRSAEFEAMTLAHTLRWLVLFAFDESELEFVPEGTKEDARNMLFAMAAVLRQQGVRLQSCDWELAAEMGGFNCTFPTSLAGVVSPWREVVQ